MFDSWFDLPFEEEEITYEDGFNQYCVSIHTEGSALPPVFLSVWAADFESALTCGEVLSAVYLG